MSDNTATVITGWDATYPAGGTDARNTDEQFNMLKTTLLAALKFLVVSNTDSPVTAVLGKAYAVDLSGGSVVINLPSVGATDDGFAMPIKVDHNAATSVTCTVNRADTDTVRGDTSLVIDTPSYETWLVYDHANTNWMG